MAAAQGSSGSRNEGKGKETDSHYGEDWWSSGWTADDEDPSWLADSAWYTDELRGKLSIAFESTPFELAEAVLGGNRRRAARSLRAMFDRGVRQRDGKVMDQGGLFPFATSWLFGAIAQVYEGRLLLDSGSSLRDVPGQVGVRGFVDRYQEQVRHNDLEQLERGLLAILACQREQRQSGEDYDVLLERFLDRWFDGTAIPGGQEFGW